MQTMAGQPRLSEMTLASAGRYYLEHWVPFGDPFQLFQRRVGLDSEVVASRRRRRLRESSLLQESTEHLRTLLGRDLLGVHAASMPVFDNCIAVGSTEVAHPV